MDAQPGAGCQQRDDPVSGARSGLGRAGFAAVKNFTRSVNQGLKKLAKKLEIDENISTYYARHSFSTNAIRSGASMELVSEQLGHSNLKTTQNYFSGFEDDSIEDITKKLMNF